MRTSLVLAFIAGSSSLGAQATVASPSAAPTRVAVKAAHLVDPRGTGRRIDDAVVLINGDTVVQVGAKLPVPNGYQVVDLGRADGLDRQGRRARSGRVRRSDRSGWRPARRRHGARAGDVRDEGWEDRDSRDAYQASNMRMLTITVLTIVRGK